MAMDLAAVLREVDTWPVEDRMRLVEVVWDRLLDVGAEPELTEAQRTELDRRIAALDANPEDVVSWDEVQQRLRRPR
jgi:putative addiction module component (TIGR02574 family)